MNIIRLTSVEATAFQLVLEPAVQDYYACSEHGGGDWEAMDELMNFDSLFIDLAVVSIVLSDEAKDLLVDLLVKKIQELALLEATSPILSTLAYKLVI